MIIVSAIPFTLILVAMMVSFANDLRSDPLVIRRRYAVSALQDAVRQGVDRYGDNFSLTVHEAPRARARAPTSTRTTRGSPTGTSARMRRVNPSSTTTPPAPTPTVGPLTVTCPTSP
ncbi:hypothetical protein [Tessaracoccus coleopterorum]|uniref:hypothetical protein n=1 Tax=Tessaracoccus coleopterorum TaxID=2714950 RepID=UPI0018D36119|nr:hypothetical protein [Tessaracoccus coleopterorum]